MKRIAWITSDFFIDVDLPIIQNVNFNDQIKLDWYVIFEKNRVNNYSIKQTEYSICCINVKLNFIFFQNRFRSLITFFQIFKMLVNIRNTNPDVLYVNADIEPYMSILIKLLFNTKRVIIAIHDVVPHKGVSRIHYFFLLFKVYSFSYFQVFSENQKDIFVSKYQYKNLFHIPLYLQNFGKSNVKPTGNKISFLFFGTIRFNKGLEILIEAANKLAVLYNGLFTIKIAGKCSNWHDYDKLIQNKDVFNYSLGAIPNEKVADLICGSHYIVLPYIDVTQSGPLMLAFNYGIPPIASNLSGFNEHIINRKTGYLFQTENVNSLFEVMREIIVSKNVNYEFIKLNLNEYVEEKYNLRKIKLMYLDMFNDI